MADDPGWDAVKRFHGHLGPWLALGMKMGAEAMEVLQARMHFGVRVWAECPLAPPPSCLLDGLQWSTGATYGKQNLRAEASDQVRVWVENTDTGCRAVVRLQPDAPERMRDWLEEGGDEAAAQRVWEAPAVELFLLEVGGASDGNQQ